MSDLTILRLSHCSASIAGGQEIILLCDRITKDDIQVKFYEEQGGQVIWESLADFQPNDVHKQVAIVFKVPKYYQEFINQPLTVFIQLRRPSDGHLSEARPFQFTPSQLDSCSPIVRKRQKYNDDNLDLQQATSGNKKRNFAEQQQSQLNEFRVPRLNLNPMQIDNSETQQQAQATLNALQPPSFFMQQDTNTSPIQQQTQSPTENFNENFLSDSMMHHNFIKNENKLRNMNKFQIPQSSSFNNNSRNRFTFGQIKEEPSQSASFNIKAESLELDIDANDLMSDINFNNMMVHMGSESDIIFNSSGNIKMESSNDASHETPNTLLGISNQQNNQINF